MSQNKGLVNILALIGLGTVAVVGTVAAYQHRKEISEKANEWAAITISKLKKDSPYADEKCCCGDEQNTCEPGVCAIDTDGDGKTDAVLYDVDNDGNPDFAAVDTDGDGKTDVILADTDGDGEFDAVVDPNE